MANMTYTINERVLTDDTITFHADGTVSVTYHTYASPNSDRKNVVAFGTVVEADRFVLMRYGKSWDQLVYGTDTEDGE